MALLVMRRVNGETMKQSDGAATDEQKLSIKPPKMQRFCCLTWRDRRPKTDQAEEKTTGKGTSS